MTFGTYVAKFPQPCLLRFPAARVVSNGIFSWWMMIIPKIKSETWINHQPKGVSWTLIDGRKFESQTSDIWTDAATVVGSVREEKVPRKKIEGNLEVKLPTAWTHGKAEVGRVREEKESEEKESVIRKKIKAHERVETSRSRSTVLFQCFEAPEGRKVGSLKHRVQSHLGEWETIDCARMRREAHFEVKKKSLLEHFWKLSRWKKCTPLGALLEVELFKKITRGRRNGFNTLPKMSHTSGFWSSFICKVACRVGLLKAWDFWRGSAKMHVACTGTIRETSPSDMLGGQGADFLRRSPFWSIRSSALLRWPCGTGAALRMTWSHFFVAGLYSREIGWENHKTHWHEAVSSSLNFPFLKEVSPYCFVFWCCQNLRKSRRTCSFWICGCELRIAIFGGSLAELLRFGAVNLYFLRKSRFTPISHVLQD